MATYLGANQSTERPRRRDPLPDCGTHSRRGDAVQASLEETLRLLQRKIGYAEGTALTFDPVVLLPTQFAATVPIDPARALLACRNEQRDDDVFKFRDLAFASPPAATLSVDVDPECRSSIRWQELNLPRGRRHELRAALVDPQGSCWGAVALYRKDGIRFSPSEVDAVTQLLPTRASILARSMVSSRAPGSPDQPTTLLISGEGAVIGGANAALRWIQEIRASESLDRVGMLLASLAAHIQRVEAAARQGPVRVRLRSSGGAWTTLIGEALNDGDDSRRGSISVIAMPSDSAQLFPLLVAAFGLSLREEDVVGQVLQGCDTKTIASHLYISRNTVQDHLKSVFDKTGVRSRRELAHLLSDDPLPVP